MIERKIKDGIAVRPTSTYWPENLPRSISYPVASLWDNLDSSARRFPNKPLVIFFGRPSTFAEVKKQAEAVAGWLQQVAGVKKGDRVLLYTQNCPQHIIAYYAILRAGAVVVPVNPMNRAEELKHYIADSGSHVAILASDLASNVQTASASLPPDQRLTHLLVAQYADAIFEDRIEDENVSDWISQRHEVPPDATAWSDAIALNAEPGSSIGDPDDLAVMPYTSGTTGFPKGCMHSHRTVMHNTVGGNEWAGVSEHSMIFGTLPLFHVTGMIYGMHGPIYAGATVVMLPRWDRENAGRLIFSLRRYALDQYPNHGDRSACKSELGALRPVFSSLHQWWRRGDA